MAMATLRFGRAVTSGAPAPVFTGDERGRHDRGPVDLVRHRGHLVVLPTRSPPEDGHA